MTSFGASSEGEVEFNESYAPTPVTEEDEGDVIDSVHDFRLVSGADPSCIEDSDEYIENLEFLIKWKKYSHLHNTWDKYEYLKGFKGIKKLDNYIRNIVLEDQYMRMNPETSREELEQHDINMEIERDMLKDYKTIERIIASRESEPSEERPYPVTEYFCKWKRLPYQASTWESADLISGDFQNEIDAFLDRDRSQTLPFKSTSYSRERPTFKKIAVQPDYLIGGELRDYQLHSLNWMAYLWSRNENGILADEMGLGKTVQTIAILSYLFHTMKIYGPFLVVVPLSTIGSWQREFAKWAPDMNLICYIGDNKSRGIIRDYEFYVNSNAPTKKLKMNVCLTTFELVLKDRAELGAIKWQYLAVDEAHRLKNNDSQLHETLKDFHTVNRLLVTGTPLQNSVKELYALVHFLMPDKFDLNGDFEINVGEENQEEKIRELHERLRPYMLRRLKKDVEKSLPSKTERILRVELAPLQIHYYKNILSKNFNVLNKGVSGPGQLSLLNIAVELKKASNHPYLFPTAEVYNSNKDEQLKGIIMNSGKMVLLDKLLTRLRKDGHRVLIFSQMVRLLDIMSDYLSLRGYPYQRLDGSVGSEARKKSIEHFNAPGSPDFVFILSTRAGGLGINLETADTVIIFDSDWNPQNDLQAMARAHRIGQKNHVNVYRFVSKDTIEEDIIERAKRKMVLEYCIIKQMDTSGLSLLQKTAPKTNGNPFSKEELSAILKFGASNMFKEHDNQKKLDDMDLDDILARAEHHETTEGQGATDGGTDFLNQFVVTDYEAGADLTWEDIIPEHERKRIEEEEKAKEEEMLWTSRKRNVVSYADDGRAAMNNGEPEEKGKRRRATSRRAKGKSDTELNDRDVKALVRSMLKFGDIRLRYDLIVEDAELEERGRDLVIQQADELMKTCEKALKEGSEEEGSSNKRASKVVHAVFNGVPAINAGALVQRVGDLSCLSNRLEDANLEKFRLSFPLKPYKLNSRWGQKDDSMLLVGIFKHGFGSWDKIKEDPSLGLHSKMTKEDASKVSTKTANSLTRRGDYLLKALRESEETKQKYQSERAARGSGKHQPKPSASKKSKETAVATKELPKKTALKHKRRSPSPKPVSEDEDSSNGSEYESMDEMVCKDMLRPVKRELRRLREDSNRCNSESEKVAMIKECMSVIGRKIEELVQQKRSDKERWRKHLWVFASYFWPRTVSHKKLVALYEKLEAGKSASKGSDRRRSDRRTSERSSNDSKRRRSRDHDDDSGSDYGSRKHRRHSRSSRHR
ncbi:hypothetical protein K493DRAFT_250596 [Basidiobolus meristosporus CBS 931.73]|uniref:Uncharacterized protein n=1 Tax=Basidiobolus meristosporus CBS 931.73 TaxID=1314790 RepID=A0A1Y1ZDT6_9FUNG|nr:hypothetical protein K493DRAFT_250596 [Basidiobolus meristosporus CBS 931.73]|eukprot:ORY08127.1 hypothetical protein K493DRAFT_250596 [Basidiobolus meristosporus CBS 931.73]